VWDTTPCQIPFHAGYLTTMVQVCHIVTQAGVRFPMAPETCSARLLRSNTAIDQVGPGPWGLAKWDRPSIGLHTATIGVRIITIAFLSIWPEGDGMLWMWVGPIV